MVRRLSGSIALLVSASLVVACGSSKKNVPRDDSQVTIPDGSSNQDSVNPGNDTGPSNDTGPAADTGVPPNDDNFGDVCDQNNPCKNSSMSCIFVKKAATDPDPTSGFCTKECTNQLQPCTGGPGKTNPYCVLKVQDASGGGERYFCGFICKVVPSGGAEQTWDCPSTQVCDPTGQTQNGSSQHACFPPQ